MPKIGYCKSEKKHAKVYMTFTLKQNFAGIFASK